jgi:ABC-type hemin transport system substrate-binding protein
MIRLNESVTGASAGISSVKALSSEAKLVPKPDVDLSLSSGNASQK